MKVQRETEKKRRKQVCNLHNLFGFSIVRYLDAKSKCAWIRLSGHMKYHK